MSVNYRDGDLYYRLTFSDPKCAFPTIETFVLVGKNLSDEDIGETWYFQFADSYVRFGSVVGSTGGDRRVVVLNAEQLSDMMDLKSLVVELSNAELRRSG